MALKIYSSSAGSGKTYTITYFFLKLILSGKTGDFTSHILAITFTNKAASEMKERIIRTLWNICNNSEDAITANLVLELKVQRPELLVRAKEALKFILFHYSSFHISTIDSFFQKVTTAFSRDLQLQEGFEVLLEESIAISEAVKATLRRAGC